MSVKMSVPGKTTIKVSLQTGAAKDDALQLNEDGVSEDGSFTLDVLSNDPGSARLYSVWQPQNSSRDQFPVVDSVTLEDGATLAIKNGTLTYTPGFNVNELRAGETHEATFTYTIQMANGALSTASVTLTILGENDDASISGDAKGEVTEDVAPYSASGTVTVTDPDRGESLLQLNGDNDFIDGEYGQLFLVHEGNGVYAWTYVLNNHLDEVQQLNSGDLLTDTFTLTSLDGTANWTINITINGADEPDNPDGGTRFIVNFGGDVINERNVYSNFKDGDYLFFNSNKFEYSSHTTGDYDGDGNEDTFVYFNVDSNNEKSPDQIAVVLLGYTGFNELTQLDPNGQN